MSGARMAVNATQKLITEGRKAKQDTSDLEKKKNTEELEVKRIEAVQTDLDKKRTALLV